MSIEKSKELQERIVITIFENAPENWDKYCQYLELIPLDDDFDNSLLSVWFNGSEEMDYKINASNEYALYKLFAELNIVMKQTNKRWTTCKMQVTSDVEKGTVTSNKRYLAGNYFRREKDAIRILSEEIEIRRNFLAEPEIR